MPFKNNMNFVPWLIAFYQLYAPIFKFAKKKKKLISDFVADSLFIFVMDCGFCSFNLLLPELVKISNISNVLNISLLMLMLKE